MPNPPVSGLGLFISARCYVETAFAVAQSRTRRKRFSNDLRYAVPTLMLLGHAAELYLKSWLLGSGALTQAALERKPFGHSLFELYKAAKASNMPEPEMQNDHSVEDLIESLGPNHSDYSYRYFPEGAMIQIWKLSSAFQVFSAWDAGLRDAVGGQKPTFEFWSLGEADDYRIPR